MSLWSRLWKRDVSGMYDNGGTSTAPAEWLVSMLGGGPTASGVQIDEWVAEGMPAVYACVHAISETVGQLPLKLYLRTDGGRQVADAHPLYLLLHDLPNPEMTAYQFKELLTRHLAMWGRAYAYIQRDRNNEVVALWPIHPQRVKVDRDSLNRKRYIIGMPSGVPLELLFDADRPPILHLHMNSNDGLDGRSPIWINRESLGITKATQDFVGAYFANGAVPGLVITHPGKELSPKAVENFRRQWNEKFGGAKNNRKVALLPEGVTMTVVGSDAQKSQLTELADQQISAAARIWRVPSFIIENHSKDTSWGSGIAERMIGWINTGLMPYFEQWQQAIQRDCLSRKTYRTHYAKFVTAALERGDLKSTMDALAVAHTNTILNANECREKLDENNIGAQGDTYLIPSGAQVLDKDGNPVVEDPAPVPTDDAPMAKGSEAVN